MPSLYIEFPAFGIRESRPEQKQQQQQQQQRGRRAKVEQQASRERRATKRVLKLDLLSLDKQARVWLDLVALLEFCLLFSALVSLCLVFLSLREELNKAKK